MNLCPSAERIGFTSSFSIANIPNVTSFLHLYVLIFLQDDVESRSAQVRRHASFSSRGSEKTEQQAAIKRHASSESARRCCSSRG